MNDLHWPACRDESMYDGFRQHITIPLVMASRTDLPEVTELPFERGWAEWDAVVEKSDLQGAA